MRRMNDEAIDPKHHMALLRLALDEDHAREDLTSLALVPADRVVVADVLAKQNGIVCGMPLMAPLFAELDERVQVESEYVDGDRIGARSVLMTVSGPARAVLMGERPALNILGRLSGVATQAGHYVEAAMGTGVHVHDTRKTTPGWRVLEKYAVRTGGAKNHRMHLADAGMIKENHLKAAYGETGPDAIARAVRTCIEQMPAGHDLYVEVESLDELRAAADAGATVIMLDELDLGAIRQAVREIRQRPAPRPVLEITGGVTLENIGAYAAAGVQRISVGALTHSAPNFNWSMQVRREPADA